MWIAICGVHTAESLFTRLIFFTFHCAFGSEVVLETRVLVSRRLEDKNESLGLEHLVLVSVLKKKYCSFSRLLLVILDGSEQGTPWHFVRDNKSSLPFIIIIIISIRTKSTNTEKQLTQQYRL